MSNITQADLEIFIPDVGNYGLNLQAMLDKADANVLNHMSFIWFPTAYSKYLNLNLNVNTNIGFVPVMEISLLNITLLTNLFAYRTLGFYVLPSLMKTSDTATDSFAALAEFYQAQYNEELDILTKAPIYDFNRDGQFSNLDINANNIGRVNVRLVRT